MPHRRRSADPCAGGLDADAHQAHCGAGSGDGTGHYGKEPADHPEVALTIDDEQEWPYRALLLRGDVRMEMLDDVAPEYEAAAHRYFGDEQGAAWVSGLRGQPMARLTVRPRWARVLDFVTRFPSALSA